VETIVGAAGSALHAASGPVGAVVGRIAGRVGGWWSTAAEAISDIPREEEQLCRLHFESYDRRPPGLTFETARTAYQIGYMAAENPSYRDRQFDSIETDLRHGLGEVESEEYAALRDFSRFGYERALIIRPSPVRDRVRYH
jgi:hypothetical protein